MRTKAGRVWQRVSKSDFDALTDRELYAVMAIAAVLLVVLAVLAFRYIEPPPPHTLRISTGAASGAYDAYARRYAALLKKDGIALEIVPSQGSAQNLERIADASSGVATTFVQSGSAGDAPPDDIEALASVAYEPVWLFLRSGLAATRPAQLAGQRVAIGARGSGVRQVADAILGIAGVTSGNARLEEANPAESVPRLVDGQLDAVFVVAAFDAPIVQQALRAGLLPMDFEQADAYARRLPWLKRVTLPKGVVDLAAGRPDHDIALLAATTDLVVRADLHKALAFLLMDVATNVHGSPGVFNGIKEFPSIKSLDFPQSEESKRYLATGRPLLQRYLPFWLANLVQRLTVSVLPLLRLLWPLLRAPSKFLKWRAQSRIARIYDELKEFEQATSAAAVVQRERVLARLADFDRRLEAVQVVSTHLVDFYNCKAHIDMLRTRYAPAPPG